MRLIAPAVACYAAEIARLSADFGTRVVIDQAMVASRGDVPGLKRPGLWSANRSCRLMLACDGWIAVNLARADDLDLVPAWIGRAVSGAPWRAILRYARETPGRELVARARLLGLPAAGVGEIGAGTPDAPWIRMGQGFSGARRLPLTVVDLSSLWAGPLCGAILAEMGASVTKVESPHRPDGARAGAAAFYRRMNGGKSEALVDLSNPAAVARLRDTLMAADVVITSARPRAFEQLGLSPAPIFAGNPGLVWVAITGYGWTGEGANWVAFGDDAAAAGGLVRWTPRNEPRFLGDALADPLTGLAGAAGALRALTSGGGVMVDAALASRAAAATALQAETIG